MKPTTHSRPNGGRLPSSASWRCGMIAVWFIVLMVNGISGFDTKTAEAQTTSREYKVKVAYLYNFSRYMTWPSSAFEKADAPFTIGVMGTDPMGDSLNSLTQKKRAHGRKVEIKHFTTPDEFTPCHILFISLLNSPNVHSEILRKTTGTPVLLVGEVDGFARQGAGASFFVDGDGTVGFRINIDSLTEKQIMVDAKLLRLAEVVRNEPATNRTGLLNRGASRK